MNQIDNIEMVCGYKFNELVFIADMLSKEGYTQERLHALMCRLEDTFTFCWEHTKFSAEKTIKPEHINIKIGIEALPSEYYALMNRHIQHAIDEDLLKGGE